MIKNNKYGLHIQSIEPGIYWVENTGLIIRRTPRSTYDVTCATNRALPELYQDPVTSQKIDYQLRHFNWDSFILDHDLDKDFVCFDDAAIIIDKAIQDPAFDERYRTRQ